MRQNLKQYYALRGIGQHYPPHKLSLTVDDVVGIVCLIGTIVALTFIVLEA